MSETIRKYIHPKNWFKEGEDLELTALVGGDKYGNSIQFTINGCYTVLTEKQLLDLISTISRRLNCKTGFTATGTTELKTVDLNGDIFIEEGD